MTSYRNSKGLEKIIETILGLIIVIIAFKTYISANTIGMYSMPEDKVYIRSSEGFNYILETTSSNSANIYIYDVGASLVNRGVKIKCDYSNIEYNKLLGPLHVHPDMNLLFWKHIAFFDSNDEIRAKGKMVFSEPKQINFKDYNDNLLGTFYDTIIEKEHKIIFCGLEFVEATGRELKNASDVMDYFERYAY